MLPSRIARPPSSFLPTSPTIGPSAASSPRIASCATDASSIGEPRQAVVELAGFEEEERHVAEIDDVAREQHLPTALRERLAVHGHAVLRAFVDDGERGLRLAEADHDPRVLLRDAALFDLD